MNIKCNDCNTSQKIKYTKNTVCRKCGKLLVKP